MKYLLYTLLLISFSATAQIKTTYSKARIHINSQADLTNLISNGIAADSGLIKQNTFIESVFSTKELNKAKALGYPVEIIIEDAQAYYKEHVRDAEMVRNATCGSEGIIDYETPGHFELGGMGGFYTYAEMLAELDEMHDLYPDLITIKSQIGTFNTYENRPIYWVKISDNPNVDEDEPEVLYDAIHHAREPASLQQLIFYMWYLLENYESDSGVQTIVDNTEMYFIPVINVDGYIYNETIEPGGGGMWRKNMRDNGDGTIGVDLNRNYSYHWGEAGTSDSDGQTYPGTAPFSETETQAVKWFCEQHNFVLALNAHTHSQLLLYPYGYDYGVETPDNATFEAISEIMVSQNGYNNILSSELYAASGDSDDWMYGETSTHNKILAMTPEIGDAFWPSISSIIPICKEMVFLNLTAAKIVHNFAEVTDTTPIAINEITGDFTYSIKRLGIESGDFTVSIVPLSENIVEIGDANVHSGMALSEEISSGISYSLNPDIASGESVEFKLIIDNGLFQEEKIVSKSYGNISVFFSDSCDDTSQWEISSWGTSTAHYHSPGTSMTDSPSGYYEANSNTSIVLDQEVDLTNASIANVSFYTIWLIENNWDYVQFEVSTDNGATWIPQCGIYTNAGVENQGVLGEPVYDGQQNTWVHEMIDLSDYLGETVKFRFQLVSDAGVEQDGFYFDDFSINILQNTTGSEETDLLEQITLFPIPATDLLQIEIPNISTNWSVELLNISGQVVLTKQVSNSVTSLKLNGMSTGVYFVKIASEKGSRTMKLVVK